MANPASAGEAMTEANELTGWMEMERERETVFFEDLLLSLFLGDN